MIFWERASAFNTRNVLCSYQRRKLLISQDGEFFPNYHYRELSLLLVQQKLLMMQLVKGIQRSLKRKGRCGVTIATSLRHTKKCCWKLYETPQNWKCSKFPEKGSQGMQAVAESRPIIETSLFSKEQLEHLYRLFNQSQPSHNSPSCSLPPKGNLRICSLYS